MTILRTILAAIILCLMPLVAIGADDERIPDAIHLRMVEGDVQIKMAESEDWVPASSNMPLYQGDKLWVPDDAKAELKLSNGTAVRLGGNTALELLSVRLEDYQFYVDEGHVYVNYREPRRTGFTINTPVAALRAVDPSVFRVDAQDQGPTTVSALKGSILLARDRGEMRINAGDRLVQYDSQSAPELTRLDREDKWEGWNRARDEEIYGRRAASNAYLPEELHPYSNDFDSNGRWENVPEYGNVWIPTVIVGADWSPYRIGRWVWIRGDYVWISYEPWGWAPYHYGRWAFLGHRGWCWVPPVRGAVYWGPGYVGWVSTPTSVAWVPLAPREVYYGRGHFGPHSVNIIKVNVQVTTVRFANVKVVNAVTTLNRDAFLTGRHKEGIRMHENPFLKNRPSLGAPQIKPVRTMMPVVKEIPAAKRPPQRLRDNEHFGPKAGGLKSRQEGPVRAAPAGPVLDRTPPVDRDRPGRPNRVGPETIKESTSDRDQGQPAQKGPTLKQREYREDIPEKNPGKGSPQSREWGPTPREPAQEMDTRKAPSPGEHKREVVPPDVNRPSRTIDQENAVLKEKPVRRKPESATGEKRISQEPRQSPVDKTPDNGKKVEAKEKPQKKGAKKKIDEKPAPEEKERPKGRPHGEEKPER